MTRTYALLDAEIIKSLPKKGLNFGSAVRDESERLAKALVRDRYRVIDGRLQALRKAGKIKFDSKTGWAVVPA